MALAHGGRVRQCRPCRERTAWIVHRAGFIYLAHVALTLAALRLSAVTVWPPWAGERTFGPNTLIEVLTFGRIVGFMNVLPIYLICLLFTPLALRSRRSSALAGVAAMNLLGLLAFVPLAGLRPLGQGRPWSI